MRRRAGQDTVLTCAVPNLWHGFKSHKKAVFKRFWPNSVRDCELQIAHTGQFASRWASLFRSSNRARYNRVSTDLLEHFMIAPISA